MSAPRFARRLAQAVATAPRLRTRAMRSLGNVLAAPDPAAERLRYEAAFRTWADGVAAEWAGAYPALPPFDVAAFDGCTYAPDTCRDCCLVHDLGCHYAATRPERHAADLALRDCIAAKAAYEGALWAWLWPVLAAVYYAGVSVYGFLWFRPSAARRAEVGT